MTCNRHGWNGISVIHLVVLLMVYFSIPGCGRDPACETDIQGLKRLSQQAFVPSDVRERIGTVIAEYQNRVRDPEPILIMATLVTPKGTEKHDFALWVFDEDRDLSGFVVREESIGADGTTMVIEEQYPVFVHLTPTWVTTAYERYSVPVRIRDAHQRKDETLWADYLDMDFDKLVKEELPDRSLPDFWYDFWRLWEHTMPPVWISLPASNQLDVSFYVYDKAGHRSNAVNLLTITEGGKNGVSP